ncbi:peptidase S24/S26A/S26B/S26C, partial [Phlyctochytrium arcticum]
ALAVIPPALIFVKFGFSVGTVEGRSMQPTFNPDKNGLRKDWVLLDRYSPARGIYKVGQVVVLTNPNQPNMKLIKRIVALPGDAVRPLGKEIEGYITIPKGHCWVESDEPFRGVDSNVFGPVPLGLIDAKVSMVLWPFERFG